MSEVRWRASAKVNLALSVAPPEPADTPKSGWHRIASWFHAVDLHDELHIRELRTGEPSMVRVLWAPDAPQPSRIDWPIESDLASRAVRALEAHLGRPLSLDITLVKRIPVGGGLGGGSSDAAAALLAVLSFRNVSIESGALNLIASSLGSDVPFFLDQGSPDIPPRPALVQGFGESITRLTPPAHPTPITLVFPPFGCSTREVYRRFDATLPPGHALRDVAHLARSPLEPASLFNDLYPAANDVSGGKLEPLAEALRVAASAPVLMSGSGSTLIVFSDDPRLAAVAAGFEAASIVTRLI
jgi:4-diphosphocytidyl-2-C-methyl-D-erythritol kinase